MRLSPSDSIFGIPVLRLRDSLRACGILFSASELAHRLRIPIDEVEPLFAELLARGLIELDSTHHGEQLWRPSAAGAQFASAPGTRPIARATADRLLAGLLGRVQRVNREDQYLYKVTKVGVFGSYLGDAERLGDVDVAVELAPKEPDRERHLEACEVRTARAAADGRSFKSLVDRIYWPQTEVLLILKHRARALALVMFDNPVLGKTQVRIIYEEP